ncbi:virulence factor Mce family protein [Mycolicibacterium pallens]|uniref:Virulence factor Mce family protein n=1 Tax=Mycolicibacterium pallens TaxID=370524 RepID=A0ABX8VFN9_9MYCO|nr:virulence factor Mce family protein [Mycolicibacterium pallens]QYL16362.1 virulence factor Mce family protein [Mycolicibacterium pallens]
MLDRLTKIQLSIFAVVTVLTVTAITLFYLHLPAKLGLGSYRITADFVTGGGLYQNANVTYRGVTVGRVESVQLTGDGVDANMRLNSDVKIPSNVTATVKSVSAVGEQYIDLVPPGEPSKDALKNGSRIGPDRTAVGQDIADLLRDADNLVSSIGNTKLQQLLKETFKAFNGSGPELARLIQSSRQLVDEANANWPQTDQLIDQAGPFLDAQIRSGDNIRELADGLARVTTHVAQADPQLRQTLATVPGAASEVDTAFTGIRPSFPVLAANLANLGRVGVIYHKSIEQALVILPALFAALITVAGGEPLDEGGKLDFKVDLGDPPPCVTGFIPAPFIRSPSDTTVRDLPTDLYCKVPQNDPSAVRGARNYPCQEFPGKRAPTVQLCRDPKGYIPIGNNPWRGPPIPAGTPVTDGRNILPPNKYPYIPPENDPDPGPPVVGPLPPGVPEGPGPAPHQPWPVQPPPNDPRQLPVPLPYLPPAPYPPQNPMLPYPATIPPPPPPVGTGPADAGPQPQASARYGTYDQHNGTFVDPAGGTGVYAPADPNLRPAENWVDLMLDPRQV